MGSNDTFGLICTVFVGILLVASFFLNRTVYRMWARWSARNWQTVPGKFKQGEVVSLVTGRRAVFVVRIEYDYSGGRLSSDLHPYLRDFSSYQEAEQCLKRLQNQSILVRIAPNKPEKSQVLDSDLTSLLQSSPGAVTQ